MKNNLPKMLIFSLLSTTACQQPETYTQGRILYQNFCANCHMEDGLGLKGIIPPLAGADFLQKNAAGLPCLIRNGMSGELTVDGVAYQTEMPGAPKLTEFEITNIINFINTSWGNKLPVVKHNSVRAALEQCQ